MLDAASRAGVVIPYSCRTGRCSTCKCRVISGTTVAKADELGLSTSERERGWVLSCVRTAETDVVIEVDELANVSLPPIKTIPCRIMSIERLASSVVKVLLRLPPTMEFQYLPGQYIDIIGAGGIRRSYSLANAHAGTRQLELHIRSVDQGSMSAYWFEEAKVNDLLRLNGPLGTFFLRSIEGLHLVFLATGTGIAPVKAMLESLQNLPRASGPASIQVYWGGRWQEDIYWDVNSLRDALDPSIPFEFVPVLSRADDDWDGVRGHVQRAFLARQPNLSATMIYACGSDAMIHAARDALIARGLPSRRFLSDAFVSSAVN